MGVAEQRNRTATLNQDPFDPMWDINAKFTPAEVRSITKSIRPTTKRCSNWTGPKQKLVSATVCVADLCRTPAQRRSDAWVQMAADAAANEAGMAPIEISHAVVWSAAAYEEMARRFAGAKPQPIDIDDYRCETINGDSLDPVEAFASSLVNKIRRVVVDAKGVVIDKGRARYFTGLTRDAVRITGRECFWPGCRLPATRCETDHLHDHAKGGRTNLTRMVRPRLRAQRASRLVSEANGGMRHAQPMDGSPACFAAPVSPCHIDGPADLRRVETGQIRIQRPDGTEITQP